MEKNAKIALFIAAGGLAVNQYEKNKLKTQPYLYSDEQNLKLLGGVVAIAGGASALIFQGLRNHPKAKKAAFVGLGGIGVLAVVSVIYAMKKFT